MWLRLKEVCPGETTGVDADGVPMKTVGQTRSALGYQRNQEEIMMILSARQTAEAAEPPWPSTWG